MSDKQIRKANPFQIEIIEKDDEVGETGLYVETLLRDNCGDGTIKLRVYVGEFWTKDPDGIVEAIHDAVVGCVRGLLSE